MAENVTKIREDLTADGKMPSAKTLSALLRECREHQGKMDEAKGFLGTAIKNADEKSNVHRKAFKTIMMILGMDDEKRDAFLSHFDDYREKLGVDEGRSRDLLAAQ